MGANPIAVITADWHIKNTPRAYSRFPATFDVEFSLQEVVRVLDQFPGLPLLLLGDIFDYRMLSGYAVQVLRELGNVKNPTTCMFVLGQHDPSDPPVLEHIKVPNVELIHVHGRTEEVGPFTVHFHDFQAPSFGEWPTSFQDGDVLMTHQVWKDLLPVAASSWSVSEVAAGKEITIFSGDYHFFDDKQVDGCRLVSPGPIRTTDFGCIGPKYVLVWYDDGSLEKIPIRSRPFLKFMISSEDVVESVISDIEEAIEQASDLPEELRKPMVWLRISTSVFTDVASGIRYAVGDKAFIDMTAVSTDAARRKVARLEKGAMFRDAVDKFLEGTDAEDCVKDAAVRLWMATDVRRTVEKVVDELTVSEDTDD